MSNWKDSINCRLFFWVIGSLLLFVIFPIIYNQYQQNQQTHHKQTNHHPPNKQDEDKTTPKVVWGVDSASKVTKEIYACVENNFGKPKIWGRYTKTNKGVSTGLTKDEVKLLQEKDVGILLIYNHFDKATTKKSGEAEAKTAITFAKDIKAPKGTVIFADIEPKYPVDSSFIQGWHETMQRSDYQPGIYGVFDPNQKLYDSFNKAAKSNKNIKNDTILWSAAPQKGVSQKKDAPKYVPSGPKDSLIYGYQYGIEAKSCNIDTDLFKGRILQYTWQ